MHHECRTTSDTSILLFKLKTHVGETPGLGAQHDSDSDIIAQVCCSLQSLPRDRNSCHRRSKGKLVSAVLMVSLLAAIATPLEVLKGTMVHKGTAAASVIDIAFTAKLCCKEVEGFLICGRQSLLES